MDQNKDQGSAAVRGEAVAETDLTTIKCPSCNGHGLIGGHSGQTPESYEEHAEVCDDCDGQGKIIVSKSDLAAFVSARAADAPSEPPTEILAKVMTRDDFNCSTELGYAQFLAWAIWLKSYRNVSPDFSIMDNLKGVLSQIDNMVCGLSRAADALDSHPTDNGKFLCAMEFEAVELGYTGLAEAMAALRRMKAEPDAGREALIACLGDDAATLSHINPDDEMAQTMRDAIAMLESDEVVIATLGMSSSQPTEPVADVQARVRDAVAENLRGLYYCGRVWSAWSYGTMSESDFAPAEEDDDVVTNITDAVMATIAPASSQPTEGDGCDECRHTYCLSGEICRHCGDVNGTQGWKGGLQPTDGGVRNG